MQIGPRDFASRSPFLNHDQMVRSACSTRGSRARLAGASAWTCTGTRALRTGIGARALVGLGLAAMWPRLGWLSGVCCMGWLVRA